MVGGLSPASLYAKLESHTNLIIAIDNESLGPNYHKLAQQVNIIQPLDQFNLIDHSATQNNSVQLIANNHLGPIIQTDQFKPNLPILFNGVGHLSNRSPMVYPVGHCSSSCYSPEGSATGSAITLVSAVQLKNNNRLIWSGSLDLFTDQFTHQTNNELFTTQISSWAFQQSGVLRLDSVRHSRRVDHQSLSLYKVNDQIVSHFVPLSLQLIRQADRYYMQDYSVRLSTLLNGSFVPMLVSDAQVELTMLDPHLRLSLSPNQSDNSLDASFTAPDRHGVFTLNFDYRRPGYSFVQDQTLISLAPPRHNQFDRFIKGAAPFYAGAATVSLATISFIALWASL